MGGVLCFTLLNAVFLLYFFKGYLISSGKQLVIYGWTFLFLSSFKAGLNGLYTRDNLAHFALVDLLESLLNTPLLGKFSHCGWGKPKLFSVLCDVRVLWYSTLSSEDVVCLALQGFILCRCSLVSKTWRSSVKISGIFSLHSFLLLDTLYLHILMALASPNCNFLSSTKDMWLLLEFSFPAPLSPDRRIISFIYRLSRFTAGTACCLVSENTRSRKLYIVCYHFIKKVEM